MQFQVHQYESKNRNFTSQCDYGSLEQEARFAQMKIREKALEKLVQFFLKKLIYRKYWWSKAEKAFTKECYLVRQIFLTIQIFKEKVHI